MITILINNYEKKRRVPPGLYQEGLLVFRGSRSRPMIRNSSRRPTLNTGYTIAEIRGDLKMAALSRLKAPTGVVRSASRVMHSSPE